MQVRPILKCFVICFNSTTKLTFWEFNSIWVLEYLYILIELTH